MSRREFSKPVKRQASARAEGKCESCGNRLKRGEGHYDHIIPDALGGEPALDNCQLICLGCHTKKTNLKDVPVIAKTRRIQDREIGIRNKPTLKSRGFSPAPAQHSASRPIQKRNARFA